MLTQLTKKISSTSNLVSIFTYNASNHWVPNTGVADSGSGLLNLTNTLTFDAIGNLSQIDGPRTDVTDVRNFTWDPQRRLTNVIEPDPDGAAGARRRDAGTMGSSTSTDS